MKKSFLVALSLFILRAPVDAAAADVATSQFVTQGEIKSGTTMRPFVSSSMDGSRTLYPGSNGWVVVDWSAGSEKDIVDELQQFAWSPTDGAVLASQVWEENRSVLYVGQPGGSKRKLLTPARRMHIGPPVWSADGKTLYACVVLELPRYKSDPRDDNPPTRNTNVRIAATVSPYTYVPFGKRELEREYEGAVADRTRTLVLAIDVSSSHVGLIARGNDVSMVYPSPDGEWLALVQMKGLVADIYLVSVPAKENRSVIDLESYDDRRAGWADAADKRLTPAIVDIRTHGSLAHSNNKAFAWSPDSKHFAFIPIGRTADGDVHTYTLATREVMNLTSEFKLPHKTKGLLYGIQYSVDDQSRKFTGLLWLPGGKAIVALARGETWRIPVDASGKFEMLTAGLPQESIRILPSFDRNSTALDAKGRLLVLAKDASTRYDSIYAIDLQAITATRLSHLGVWVGDVQGLNSDKRSGPLIFAAHTNERSNNLFRLQLIEGSKPKQHTQYKMELAKRPFPDCRDLRWQTASGLHAAGVLCLPAGASLERKVPMVLAGNIGGLQSVVDGRAERGASFVRDFITDYLYEGIAYFIPDIPLSDLGVYEHPLKQTIEGVQAALDEALATGFIDADRLAIVCDDGFLVDAAVSHIDKFKVAVSFQGSAPNWFGDWDPSKSGQEFYETGAGRFALPLWDDPARYAENSPIAYVNRVKTPVLYFNGGGQQYGALARLGRTAVNISGRESLQEQRQRAHLWLREHFFDEKPTIQNANLPDSFFTE